jgi:hypothetical protein
MEPLIQRFDLEPSADHKEAEERFEDDIMFACALGYASRMSVCGWMKKMDEKVRTGAVRRDAAGRAASRLWGSEASFSCTLLYFLMTRRDHEGICVCIQTLLSWGACPTVVLFGKSGHVQDSSWRYATAFGLLNPRLQKDWSRDLLAFGSAPWPSLRRTPQHSIQCSELGVSMIAPGVMAVMQAQWWRWHARRARRFWLHICL